MDLLNGTEPMSNLDLIQSLATLNWIHTGDSAMVERVTAARVGIELYNRLSGERDVDQLRNQTILAIAQYIKKNPKAKKEDLQKVIAKYIFDFAQKINEV